jgi:hypothetical protein
MKTTALTVSMAALAAFGLAACSSGSTAEDTAASAAPSASAGMVGGMATCDEATFTQVITNMLEEDGNSEQLFSIDGIECLDGWAAVFPTVGATEEDAFTETLVFEAEDQFWIPKDRMEVCGTVNMDDPTAYPADSQVPEGIWQPACNTN